MSAPTALNMDYTQVTIEHDGEKIIKPMLVQKYISIINVFILFVYIICDKYFSRDTLINDNSNVVEIEKNGEEWHSLSCMSDSTDQSAPVNFDMYNRVNIPINNLTFFYLL